MSAPTIVTDLNRALRECFAADARVVLWGEDVLSPYGGAFKVTAGLSGEFPSRVFTTPISEAAIVGLGVGAALRGLRPVVEIMFGDFVMLAADQLVNHAAKFAGMYNGAVKVPLVVRTPMGGYRGYGPTHSQSLEKHLLGVPGLQVVAVNHFTSPGELLKTAIMGGAGPVLFIENKVLYAQAVQRGGDGVIEVQEFADDSGYPLVRVSNFSAAAKPDLTAVACGGLSWPWEQALRALAADEIRVELFLPTLLSAPPTTAIVESVVRTGRLLASEEGTHGFGFGAEIIARVAEAIGATQRVKYRQVGAVPVVIPSARSLEREMLPSVETLTSAALAMIQL